MATTIVTKNGTGAPTDSDLVAGELAVDLTNGRLYTTDLDSGGTVIEIGLNPSGNVDVTGTVTADGLTVDGDVSISGTLPLIKLTDTDNSSSRVEMDYNFGYFQIDVDANQVDAAEAFRVALGGTKHFEVGTGGDISFYEDTGTTAKFFWDASAESLGIGTTSPSDFAANANNLVVGSGAGTEGITINSGTANYGVIYFADGTSGSAAYAGNINYNHADNSKTITTLITA